MKHPRPGTLHRFAGKAISAFLKALVHETPEEEREALLERIQRAAKRAGKDIA